MKEQCEKKNPSEGKIVQYQCFSYALGKKKNVSLITLLGKSSEIKTWPREKVYGA